MTWVVFSTRLLSELALLAAVALGGAALAGGTAGAVIATLALGTVVGVWGTWIAPRARRRLDDPARVVVELALFVWGGAGLAASGRPSIGLGLVLVGWTAAIAIRWTGEPEPGVDPDHGAPTR